MAIFRASHSDDPNEIRMTLGEHLEELRSRLIRAVIALVLGAILCFFFADVIMGIILWPVELVLKKNDFDTSLRTLNPAENMILAIKVSMIVGFIITAPYSLSQIWGFVAAGLYPHERKWVTRFAPVSIGLFFFGVFFLIFVVSPMLLNVLLTYNTQLPKLDRYLPDWFLKLTVGEGERGDDELEEPVLWPTTQTATIPLFEKDPVISAESDTPPEGSLWINRTERAIRTRVDDTVYTVAPLKSITPDRMKVVPELRISETITFILHLSAAFGIGFQVPVVVAFISLIGVATAAEMGRLRRYIWFGMAAACAVLTPPDPASMMLLLFPMIILLEIGLIAARIIERGRDVG